MLASRRRRGFTLIELMIVIAIIAIIAAIAIPNLLQARKNGNETAAIAALKTLHTVQGLYAVGDKDGNGIGDYAPDLDALYANGALIDQVLRSGTRQGYLFYMGVSSANPEYLWVGTANPRVPTTTGDRYFVLNHQGVVFATTEGALLPGQFVPSCEVPATSGAPQARGVRQIGF